MPSVQQDGNVWKKRILVPFWILRIFFMVVITGFYAVAIAALGIYAHKEDIDTKTNAWKLGIGLAVFFLVLLIICLILDIVAIILFIRHNLKPRTMLIFNSIQSAIWVFLIVLEIISVSKGASFGGLISSIIIFATFLILLIYSAINCHRSRKHGKGGAYIPAHNPANPQTYGQETGYVGGGQEYNGGAYNPYNSNTAPIYNGPGVEMQNKPGAATTYYQQV